MYDPHIDDETDTWADDDAKVTPEAKRIFPNIEDNWPETDIPDIYDNYVVSTSTT